MNGEKYVFSKEVLDAGKNLFRMFKRMQNIVRSLYNKILEESVLSTVDEVKTEMKETMEAFDKCWIDFE